MSSPGSRPRATDQRVGEFENPHLLAHLKDKDLATLGRRAGLKHKSGRLWDGHQESPHLRVRDRDRAPFVDLLFEDRNDAAAAAQNVAEADAAESRRGVLFREPANDLLRRPFGRPHDARRIDRLVRGDEDERPDARRGRSACDVVRPKDVDLHCLARIVFHEADVLVGRGVEDDVGPLLLEDRGDACFVAHISDGGPEIQA